MNLGSQINNINELLDWCFVNRNRGAIRTRKGEFHEHGSKVVLGMPLMAVMRNLRKGKFSKVHE